MFDRDLSKFTIEDLPFELLLEMLSQLNLETLYLIGTTNKNLYSAFNNQSLWHEKFKRHFPHLYSEPNIHHVEDWRIQFCDAYLSEYNYVAKKWPFRIENLPSRIKQLFSLIKEGHITKFSEIFQLDDLKYSDKNKWTLIDWAKKCGYQNFLDFIYLKRKSLTNEDKLDTKKLDERKNTILHFAIICHQSSDEIDYLIQQGADFNEISGVGHNALRLAAKEGLVDIIKLLIKKYNADINLRNPFKTGSTALLLAVECRHEKVIELLLENNADVTIPLKDNSEYHEQFKVVAGDTPVHVAIKLGLQKWFDVLFSKLLSASNLSEILGLHKSAVLLATMYQHTEMVKLLIKKYYVDLNATNEDGVTALLLAIERGCKDIIDLLLEHKADPNSPLLSESDEHERFGIREKDTPLHAAIKLGDVDTTKKLLIKGANINAINGEGHNALRLAAKEGQAEIVELLIKQSQASIDARDMTTGMSALLLAVERGHENVVETLLKYHADVTISAEINDEYNQIQAGDTPLHLAARLNEYSIMHRLINHNASITVTNAQGETPLDVASKNSQCERDLNLLRYQAKLNQLSNDSDSELSDPFSQKALRAATNALSSVVFFGAPVTTLKAHKKILKSNEESKLIYKSYKF